MLNIGKAKMQEYEDPNENESSHSLDSELKGLDALIIWTNGVNKAIAATNVKLYRSTLERNSINRFGYRNDDYMAYHYALMMKVARVWELEIFSEAAKDPRWVNAINEEM